MHTVFALLCFVVVIHWLIFPYPSGLLHWHCGNLTIAPVPAKQPWWIWINTSCEFIMNDCITTTKQSTTKPCAYLLGYTVGVKYFGSHRYCFGGRLTLTFKIKFNLRCQNFVIPSFTTNVNTLATWKINNSLDYRDCIMLLTVSQSPSSAHIYIPKPHHGPDCFNISTLCTYTDVGRGRYSGL